MQQTTTTTDPFVAGLVERIRGNRLALQDTALRLLAARSVVAERRRETERLLGQARQSLVSLRERRAGARERRRAAKASEPVLPRYSPRAPDPLDAVRHELHEAYAATGDPAIRAELLESYDGFARALALKFRHRESVDDLVQVARIGLLHAIDHFDPALGRPFPLFARITITGELKRHIRDRTWAMRVPRSLQEDYLNVMRTLAELTAERSDSPSMEALAARCGISVERVLEAIELRVNQRALSIDVPAVAGADDPVIELGQEDIGFRRLEDRQLLADLLGRLPERDRRIVELRFIEELTQSEIATQVGVSQMCVSRVLARTLGRLRLWARAAVS
ncbi:MAG TPA: sigma-70 family RNA polymerase sigma factor [Acidimicrobiia bacterium]|nr:sigma-70 family RNA polymerase sigma factor [Acidimicrobiia bacterium]